MYWGSRCWKTVFFVSIVDVFLRYIPVCKQCFEPEKKKHETMCVCPNDPARRKENKH